MASAIRTWVSNRDLPIATRNDKWGAWFTEGAEYLKLAAKPSQSDPEEMRAIRHVFDQYVALLGRDPKSYLLTPQRERMLRERLAEMTKAKGSLVDAVNFMVQCVVAMTESDWHMGRNAKTNGRTFNELEHCFGRDKFQQWVTAVETKETADDYD